MPVVAAWRCGLNVDDQRKADLESGLGASPRGFESRILRSPDQAGRWSGAAASISTRSEVVSVLVSVAIRRPLLRCPEQAADLSRGRMTNWVGNVLIPRGHGRTRPAHDSHDGALRPRR